jgi:peptidoglycan hydrolase CwlO-like protein
MQIELSPLISVISALIASLALYRNLKGDTKQDAGQLTQVIVKLENISDDVREMKNDIKDVKNDVDRMKERVALNEASVKSAHKRIDYLMGHNDAKTKEETIAS